MGRIFSVYSSESKRNFKFVVNYKYKGIILKKIAIGGLDFLNYEYILEQSFIDKFDNHVLILNNADKNNVFGMEKCISGDIFNKESFDNLMIIKDIRSKWSSWMYDNGELTLKIVELTDFQRGYLDLISSKQGGNYSTITDYVYFNEKNKDV